MKHYLLTLLCKYTNKDVVSQEYEHYLTTDIEEHLLLLDKEYKNSIYILINVLEVSESFAAKYEGGR